MANKSKVTGNSSSNARDWVKVKALLYLHQLHLIFEAIKVGKLDGVGDTDRGLPTHMAFATSADIAKYAGVEVKSLRVLLGRWRTEPWGYVEGYLINERGSKTGHSRWLYKLNSRGVAYISKAPKWYSRYEEAVQVVAGNTGSIKDSAEYAFTGFPTEVARPIAWLPAGSLFEVCLVWPFAREADIVLFPTAEALRFLNSKARLKGDSFFITAPSAKEALAEAFSRFNIEPSEAYERLALDKAKEALLTTKHYVATAISKR